MRGSTHRVVRYLVRERGGGRGRILVSYARNECKRVPKCIVFLSSLTFVEERNRSEIPYLLLRTARPNVHHRNNGNVDGRERRKLRRSRGENNVDVVPFNRHGKTRHCS